MATKKGTSRKAGKKTAVKKKTASKKKTIKKSEALVKEGAVDKRRKAAARKLSAKKAAQKPKAPAGKCTDWQAWQDLMPPGPATLHVTGKCLFPTHGYKVRLREAVPQGFNPSILLLDRIVTPPSGPVIQTPQVVNVRFNKRTNMRFTQVTILPDGTDVKVQPVH